MQELRPVSTPRPSRAVGGSQEGLGSHLWLSPALSFHVARQASLACEFGYWGTSEDFYSNQA